MQNYPAIDVIGTGMVTIDGKEYQGGLYPGGSNTPTPEHATALAAQVEKIRPRKLGSICFAGLGASNTALEMRGFMELAEESGLMSDAMELVNCCKGGITLQKINDIQGRYIYKYVTTVLNQNGLDANDPQVAWLKTDDLILPIAEGDFESYLRAIVEEYIVAVGNIFRALPNLKVLYLTSRHTTRYISNPQLAKHMEPRAYYSQFVIKKLIELQITGADPRLKFAGNNPKAPLLTWAHPFYSNGAEPNTFGHNWTANDVRSTDHLHPNANGVQKTAEYLLDFFLNDEFASKFFAQPK